MFTVEGEQDADRLAARGLVATTNAMGAGSWRDDYAPFFQGRRVAILPDHDQPGREHAATVAASLSGIAAEVRVVQLPDLPEKGDISNWIAQGGDAATLLDIVDASPPWTPESKSQSVKRTFRGRAA